MILSIARGKKFGKIKSFNDENFLANQDIMKLTRFVDKDYLLKKSTIDIQLSG